MCAKDLHFVSILRGLLSGLIILISLARRPPPAARRPRIKYKTTRSFGFRVLGFGLWVCEFMVWGFRSLGFGLGRGFGLQVGRRTPGPEATP